MKTELLHRQAWPTRTAARQEISEYIEGWYNTRRRHSSLGYQSPAAYRPVSTSGCYQLSRQLDDHHIDLVRQIGSGPHRGVPVEARRTNQAWIVSGNEREGSGSVSAPAT
ncbi:IS3 family transposase [Actinoplanes sp. TFC3]|uniref:IS3 family transposase n=1 Tax=Actinoplanes sp. TFC3 TaxID=1710355 RepID=UPI0009E6FCBB